jgi:hypothetical protein
MTPAPQTRATTKEVIEAIVAGAPIFTLQGYQVAVLKVTDGRAKVRRREGDRILQAWLYLEQLDTK